MQIIVLFLLGVLGVFNALWIALVFASLMIFSLIILWKKRVLSFACGALDCDSIYLMATLVFFGITLLVSYHPAGVWDDTVYQLPLARHYLQHQSFALHEYLRFPLFPQNINLLMALGLLLGNEVLAQLFSTLPLFVMALGLMGAAQYVCKHWCWGAFTALLLFSVQPVRETLGYAYVDNGLALFCFAATLALVVWANDKRSPQQLGWIVVAAALAGTAAGTKLFGGVMAAVLGGYLLFASRQFNHVVIFGGVAVVSGVGWYLRSFLLSGDPVHPVGGPYFGYYLWDAVDLSEQYWEQRTHGVSRNPLFVLNALWDTGFVIWILAFFSMALRNVPLFVRVMQVVFGVYFFFWFFVSQVDRYLAPVYGAGMLLSSYMAYRIYAYMEQRTPLVARMKQPGVLISVVSVCLVLIAVGIVYHYRDRDLSNAIDRRLSFFNGDRHNQAAGYDLFRLADSHQDIYGSRLMQLGFENAVFFFSGTTIGDWYGLGRYRDRIRCVAHMCVPLPESEMKRHMENFNSRMLAISTIRYPDFNPETYAHDFTLLERNHHGVLFALKQKNLEY